jgi:phosphoribosyl-ATP pyrophosphohydrolase
MNEERALELYSSSCKKQDKAQIKYEKAEEVYQTAVFMTEAAWTMYESIREENNNDLQS